MEKIKYITVVVFTLLASVSCQKVINIDLKNQDPQLVIEATVTDDPLVPQIVKLTKTVNFSADNIYNAVSNASVTMSDDAGNAVTLLETTTPGTYQNSMLLGVSGRTYYLTIVSEGVNYTAASTMPQKVNLDSIAFETGFGPGSSESKTIKPVYFDPPGKGNNYRFKLKRNNTDTKNILVADDNIKDGGLNTFPLNAQDLEFKNGDTAKLTMMCIDKAVHLYFFSLSQNGTGPNRSATPANPATNISGGKALGYFSAHTIQTKQMVVQ